MKRNDLILIAFAGLASAFLGRTAAAHGVLVDPATGRQRAPTAVSVSAEVLGQVATTTALITFRGAGAGNAKFLFPTPDNASVAGFAVRRQGIWENAQMTSDAPEDSHDVRTGSAQGAGRTALPVDLLRWLGDNAFVVDVPLSGDDPVTELKLTYIEVLPYDFGEVSFTFPLSAPPQAATRVGDVEVHVDLTTRRQLRSWDAGAWTSVERLDNRDDRTLTVSYRRGASTPNGDFRLAWSVVQEDLFVDLLTHHDACDEDGYFLLIVEPLHDVSADEVLPKYFTFVLDTSGSMEGEKMEEAREAALFMVNNLNDGDRFNVVSFASYADRAFPTPQDVGPRTREDATRYIQQLWAGGGTNLEAALRTALSVDLDQGFARIVVLLTDGEPTAGITDTSPLLETIRRANRANARLFPFGVGAGLGRNLLIALAADNRGDATFFDRGSDIQSVLSDFYRRIDRPVLTDVTVDFGDADVRMTDLNGTTDLFAGTQLLVVGRYAGGARVQGALEGSLRGLKQQHLFPLDFDDCALGELPIIPRLWAKSRIDSLVAEITRSGFEDRQKIEEIERLSKRYGIQTPYTSFGVAPTPAAAGGGGGSGGAGGSGGSRSGSLGAASAGSDPDYDYGGSWYGGDLEELEASEAVVGCAISAVTASTVSGLPGWLGGVALVGWVRRRRRTLAPVHQSGASVDQARRFTTQARRRTREGEEV